MQAGRFLEVTHLDPMEGSRKDVTHWAIWKTVSQALLLSCPRSLPDKDAGVAGRGAQAPMWAGASALGLAAFHKELSAPSQFLLEAQCPGAAAPSRVWSLAGESFHSSPWLLSSLVQRTPSSLL